MTDIITTYYYTPDLMLEGNPLYYAQSWRTALVSQLCIILVVLMYCIRLAVVDYTKPLWGESFLRLILGSQCNTAIKRYSFELAVLFAGIASGFIALLLWYLGHSLRLDSVNYFLSLRFGRLPLGMVCAVVIPYILSYMFLHRYFTYQLHKT